MKRKNAKRCVMSGKLINRKDEVVLTNHAIDYVRKCGFLVSNFRVAILSILFLTLFLMPFVTSACVNNSDPDSCGGFYFPLNNRMNIVMIFLFFIVAGILFFFRQFVFCSFLVVILGFVLLFNGFNVILSTIIICGGVGVSFIIK